ncbi:topology modulation protein [Staphylococcus warneri]
MYNKVLVIGSPGSGKSALSTHLSKYMSLPLYHLDQINWKDDNQTIEQDELINEIKDILIKQYWIIDGNYIDTLELRVSHAEVVIWLQEKRVTCIWRVLKRYFLHVICKQTIGKNPKTMSLAFLKFIWDFPKINNEQIKKLQRKYPEKLWIIK